jgi:hypothetical protein
MRFGGSGSHQISQLCSRFDNPFAFRAVDVGMGRVKQSLEDGSELIHMSINDLLSQSNEVPVAKQSFVCLRSQQARWLLI